MEGSKKICEKVEENSDACIKCKKDDKQDSLLLCDKCDRGCHIFCLTPALKKVPEGMINQCTEFELKT